MRHLVLRISCALIAAGWLWWLGDGLWESRAIPPPLRPVWSVVGTAQWMQFTPDNRHLIWFDGEQFRISSADRPVPRFLLEEPLGPDSPAPVLSDDGRYMVICLNEKLERCDLQTAACQDVFPLPRPGDPEMGLLTYTTFRPQIWTMAGRMFAAGRRTGQPRLLDVSPDGRRALLWVLYPQPTILVVDMERRTTILRLPHRWPLVAGFSRQGDRFFTDAGFGIKAWSSATGESVPAPPGWFDPDVRLWCLAADRRSVALLGDEGMVRFVDEAGKELMPTVRVAMPRPLSGVWDAPRRTLRLRGEQIAPTTAQIPVDVLFHLDNGRRMNFGDMSFLLASGGPGEYVAMRYDATGRTRLVLGRLSTQQEWTVPWRRNYGVSAAFSPDGRRVAIGSGRSITIYDIDRR